MSGPEARHTAESLSLMGSVAQGPSFPAATAPRTEEHVAELYRSVLECWLELVKELELGCSLDARAWGVVARVEKVLDSRDATDKSLRLALFMASTIEA